MMRKVPDSSAHLTLGYAAFANGSGKRRKPAPALPSSQTQIIKTVSLRSAPDTPWQDYHSGNPTSRYNIGE
jgi:hypothetical protein